MTEGTVVGMINGIDGIDDVNIVVAFVLGYDDKDGLSGGLRECSMGAEDALLPTLTLGKHIITSNNFLHFEFWARYHFLYVQY